MSWIFVVVLAFASLVAAPGAVSATSGPEESGAGAAGAGTSGTGTSGTATSGTATSGTGTSGAQSVSGSPSAFRLRDRVSSPLALLSVSRPHESEQTAGAGLEGRSAGEVTDLDLVREVAESGVGRLVDLLHDFQPTADALSTFESIGSLLGLADGEIELALVALLPRDGGPSAPLLVARVELDAIGREGLLAALERPGFARRHRSIGDVQSYALQALSEPRAGAFFEVAVVGRELFVANDGAALVEVLTDGDGSHPESGESAREGSVTDDEVVQGLRDRLGPVDCELVVDWSRVRHRLGLETIFGREIPSDPSAPSLRNTDELGPSALVAEALGLHTATRLVIGLDATDAGERGSGFLHSAVVFDQPDGMSGLLAAAEPKKLHSFVDDLRASESWISRPIATVALSIDLASLLSRSSSAPGAPFATRMSASAAEVGVEDLSELVGRRVSNEVAFEIFWPDSNSDETVAMAWTISARGRRAARQLADEIASSLSEWSDATDADSRHAGPSAGGRSFGDGAMTLAVRGAQVVFGMGSAMRSLTSDQTRVDTVRRSAESASESGRVGDVLNHLAAVAFGRGESRAGVQHGSPMAVGAFLLREHSLEGVPAQAAALCLVDGAVCIDLVTPR